MTIFEGNNTDNLSADTAEICIGCACWVGLQGNGRILGICNCKNSDHFGHGLGYNHPVCRAWVQIRPGNPKGNRCAGEISDGE